MIITGKYYDIYGKKGFFIIVSQVLFFITILVILLTYFADPNEIFYKASLYISLALFALFYLLYSTAFWLFFFLLKLLFKNNNKNV